MENLCSLPQSITAMIPAKQVKPITAEPVIIELISIPMVDSKVATSSVELSWHIVCGSVEVDELSKYGHMKLWHPRNDRHALFMAMKYPNEVLYKGHWGPEILHFVDDGPYRGKVGKIYCTYNRYVDIAKWFLLTMYQP